MFGEKRKTQRYSLSRVATIHADTGNRLCECTIVDISAGGARIFVSEQQLPDRFSLLITSERPIREECQMVWRIGGEVGVEFITRKTERERSNIVHQLRTEARNMLGGVT